MENPMGAACLLEVFAVQITNIVALQVIHTLPFLKRASFLTVI
jgi:hypothetical protein